MILLVATLALAEPYRVGVFVGNDVGAPGETPLLFATSDAEKMRELFVAWGGIAPADALLLRDRSARQVEDAVRELQPRLAAARDQGRPTELIFYYSGHGDAEGLQLGSTRLGHDQLRDRLELSGAEVRVAFLDACRSGSAIREKGGSMGPSYAYAVQMERVRGTAFITASADTEAAQESSELTGGLFTYFLHGGLLGAADVDGDGDVSLTEAYDYVHSGTSLRARQHQSTQTPHFDLDLSGAGDLTLTRLDAAEGWLDFSGAGSGSFAVWDNTRRRYLGEVDAATGGRLAVRAGVYAVQQRRPGWVDEAVYVVDSGERVEVRELDFQSLAYAESVSRGPVEKAVRQAKAPDVAVRVTLGTRGFPAGSVHDTQYLPRHPVAGVEALWLPRHRKVFWSVDLSSGGVQSALRLPERGDEEVFVQSAALGGRFGARTAWRSLQAGAGVQAEAIYFRRSFLDEPLPPQASFSVAPGLTTWAGVHHGRFVADLQLGTAWMPQRWDDLPEVGRYGEATLAFGWRF
jgi:hypothetical protein